MPFRLAIVLSSNPFNFVSAHCYEWISGVKNTCIDNVNWITAHNYGKQKWHSFSPSLKLILTGNILGLNIGGGGGHKM